MIQKRIWKFKLLGWKVDNNGNFPVPRIIWNAIWYVPCFLALGVFFALVFCKGGVKDTKEIYYRLF